MPSPDHSTSRLIHVCFYSHKAVTTPALIFLSLLSSPSLSISPRYTRVWTTEIFSTFAAITSVGGKTCSLLQDTHSHSIISVASWLPEC